MLENVRTCNILVTFVRGPELLVLERYDRPPRGARTAHATLAALGVVEPCTRLAQARTVEESTDLSAAQLLAFL